MECAICYEKFFTPKTIEELENMYEENVNNNDYDEIIKFKNLLITSKHNETHICSSPNCECVICRTCWFKYTHKGKDIMEMTEDDFMELTEYDMFVCPYCKNIDWKEYMNNVFNELQQKVLGEEEFIKLSSEKILSKIFDR